MKVKTSQVVRCAKYSLRSFTLKNYYWSVFGIQKPFNMMISRLFLELNHKKEKKKKKLLQNLNAVVVLGKP